MSPSVFEFGERPARGVAAQKCTQAKKNRYFCISAKFYTYYRSIIVLYRFISILIRGFRRHRIRRGSRNSDHGSRMRRPVPLPTSRHVRFGRSNLQGNEQRSSRPVRLRCFHPRPAHLDSSTLRLVNLHALSLAFALWDSRRTEPRSSGRLARRDTAGSCSWRQSPPGPAERQRGAPRTGTL